MVFIIPFWAFAGTMYLLILTWQDFANKMYVDDRFNYLMMGISASLLPYNFRSIWYILGIIGVIIILNIFIRKTKILGTADINTFMWIFFGFAYISPNSVIYFFGSLTLVTLLYVALKKIIFKKTDFPSPYYIVILISFILANGFLGYYTR